MNNNLLIADAGATKTDWFFLSANSLSPLFFQTKGINPVQNSPEEIFNIFTQVKETVRTNHLNYFFFYGAGCFADFSDKLYNLIIDIFNVEKLEVASDMIGALLALFGDSNGIACILGTGSNSCCKDSQNLFKIPSLGYIIGDEGSGSALGKRLINGVFKKQFSEKIITSFNERYNLNVEDLILKVYKSTRPAQYLASFTEFISDNITDDEIFQMVKTEFCLFFQKNVIPYGNITKQIEIGFVGSLAYHFSSCLEEAAALMDLKISKILKSPLPELSKYWVNKLKFKPL